MALIKKLIVNAHLINYRLTSVASHAVDQSSRPCSMTTTSASPSIPLGDIMSVSNPFFLKTTSSPRSYTMEGRNPEAVSLPLKNISARHSKSRCLSTILSTTAPSSAINQNMEVFPRPNDQNYSAHLSTTLCQRAQSVSEQRLPQRTTPSHRFGGRSRPPRRSNLSQSCRQSLTPLAMTQGGRLPLRHSLHRM
jgi:hypothetical protein